MTEQVKPNKPTWASNLRSDKHGTYADLEVKGVGQRFRWINAGEFLMGSPKNEEDRESFGLDETQHKVTLTRGYWLADTACTQALWQAVMEDNPCHFKGDVLPVEEVSWNDIQDFIRELNGLTKGLNLRLPTEAEWEYACRAGTETPFSFGKTIDSEQVNFDGNYPYANSKKSEYREKLVTVGSLPCNEWGLYEMHGNVWEWCEDWYGEYETNNEITVNPRGPSTGTYRVLRGGSWNYDARSCRSAQRTSYRPEIRYYDVGFRLVSGHQEKTLNG